MADATTERGARSPDHNPTWRSVVYGAGATVAVLLVVLVLAMAAGAVGTGPFPLGTWVAIVAVLLVVVLALVLVASFGDPVVRSRDAPRDSGPPRASQASNITEVIEPRLPGSSPPSPSRGTLGLGSVTGEHAGGRRVVSYVLPAPRRFEDRLDVRTEVPVDGVTLLRLEEPVARPRS